jgi:hypothetical protein
MKILKNTITIGLAIILLISCVASPQQFLLNANTYSDLKVCRNFVQDYSKMASRSGADANNSEKQYLSALSGQIYKRSLSLQKCQELIKTDEDESFNRLLAGMRGRGRYGPGGFAYGMENYGRENKYAWDGFLVRSGFKRTVMWRCRDKSNGQFVDDDNCDGLQKNDNTWPN